MEKSFRTKFIVLLSVAIAVFIGCVVAASYLIYKQTRSGRPSGYYPPGETFFEVQYFASDGGYIVGSTQQRVPKGKDAETITAKPNEGYYFIRWSDNGKTTSERTDCIVTQTIKATAIFGRYSYTITYNGEAHGHIEGDANQTVLYGDDATQIEAVPDDGYLFAGWSDGMYANPRQDKEVIQDKTVSALYTEKVKTFTYDYNGATDNATAQSITLHYNTVASSKFAVPQKDGYEFKGWYLDPLFKTKVTDENGTLFYGHGVFYEKSAKLYAKWQKSNTFDSTYPILMVFIESAQVQLATANNEKAVNLDYQIPVLTRLVSQMFPQQFSDHLRSIFNDTVNFRIDAFYVTDTLQDIEKSYYYGDYDSLLQYYYNARHIRQLDGIREKYRTVYTFTELNDPERAFTPSVGNAFAGYPLVSIDALLFGLEFENQIREDMLDSNNSHWNSMLYACTELFAYSIDQCYDSDKVYGIYKALKGCTENEAFNGATAEYLLFKREVDGKKVGVPPSYWIMGDDVMVALYYNAGEGGFLTSSGNQTPTRNINKRIPYETNSPYIIATPMEGYKFVGWSDGVTTAIRKDTKVISTLYVTALFEKI